MQLTDLVWEEKIWGRVCHLFCSDHSAVSVLQVKAHSWCSKHYHRDRANDFHVLEGRIEVEIWPNGLDIESTRFSEVLEKNQSLTVPSKVIHRFRVLESGVVVETYWPDNGGVVDISDIVRYDVGGCG